MDKLKILNIDLEVKEDSKDIQLNVNIDRAFQDFLGEGLTMEFVKDSSLQNITDALGLLLEKYINIECANKET